MAINIPYIFHIFHIFTFFTFVASDNIQVFTIYSFFANDHSSITFAKFSVKLTFLTPWCTRSCAYQGVRNVSFSENFANVMNEWSPILNAKYIGIENFGNENSKGCIPRNPKFCVRSTKFRLCADLQFY